MGGYGLLAVMTPDGLGAGNTVPHYVHSNHLGAPMFSTDAAGQIITPGQYTQPVFPGQLQTRADLYYNRYRDYDPTTGRYIQADPIGLAGGPNSYGYANANPMRYIDPLGLEYLDFFDNSPRESALARKMLTHYQKLPKEVQDTNLFVFAHGNADVICANRNGPCVNAQQFKREIERRGLQHWRSIRLWACNTGLTTDGFAADLANDTGSNVWAPNALTWWNEEGLVGINPRYGSPNSWYGTGRNSLQIGSMRLFQRGGR